MNTGLELQDVSLSVGSRQLLSLSCTIAPGEVMTVMGASGTGKSTLLAFIAGFLNEAFTAEGRPWILISVNPMTKAHQSKFIIFIFGTINILFDSAFIFNFS